MARLESRFIAAIKKEAKEKIQKEIAKENAKLQKIKDNFLDEILLLAFKNENFEKEFLALLQKFSLNGSKESYEELKKSFL